MIEHEVVVRIMPDGDVRTLYDEVAALHELGAATIDRVTDIRWDDEWQWWMPYLLATGEPLAQHGFRHRADAVAAEVEELNRRLQEGTL